MFIQSGPFSCRLFVGFEPPFRLIAPYVRDRESICLFLCDVRFLCLARRNEVCLRSPSQGRTRKRHCVLTGCMLLVLALVLSLTHFLSLSQNMVSKHGTILMITVAAYIFLKFGFAIHRVVKAKRQPSLRFSSIRTIGYAEVAAAVLTLQRSMLVSFDEMDVQKASALNAATGAVVFVFYPFSWHPFAHQSNKEEQRKAERNQS